MLQEEPSSKYFCSRASRKIGLHVAGRLGLPFCQRAGDVVGVRLYPAGPPGLARTRLVVIAFELPGLK